MVDDAIDGRRCGHGVFEYAVPLGEHKVRGEYHAATFVAFRQQGEQDFRLVTILLDVADIVDD